MDLAVAVDGHEVRVRRVRMFSRFEVLHDGRLMGRGRGRPAKGVVRFAAHEGGSEVAYVVAARLLPYGGLEAEVVRDGVPVVMAQPT
jgi:hypothetical protein